MIESKWPCFVCGCMQAHHVWNKNGSTVPACLSCLAAIAKHEGNEPRETPPGSHAVRVLMQAVANGTMSVDVASDSLMRWIR